MLCFFNPQLKVINTFCAFVYVCVRVRERQRVSEKISFCNM